MTVAILGGNGFLGKNISAALHERKVEHVCASRINGVDATNVESLERFIVDHGITSIINCAAVCGGIGLNKKHPFKLWLATTLITANVIDVSIRYNIKKLVMLGTVCSYAANTPTPFKEDYLMSYGEPEPTNRAYGISKLNSLYGSVAAHQECGLNVANLIPVNMYGKYDNFNLETSHVVPAIIRKIHKAMLDKSNAVTLWGSGKASREFIYAEDCADAVIKAWETDTGDKFINIGTGQEIEISNLASTIARLMGWNGIIFWDSTQPDGQMRRQLDISRASSVLGWKPRFDIEEGLRRTISWYLQQETLWT